MTEEKSLTVKPLEQVRLYLFQNKEKIEALLPTTENPVQYLAQAFNFICQNPTLTQCDVQSIFQAVKDSAQSGLNLNGYLGEAYIIKYGNQAKFQAGYKGVLKHIYNTGEVTYAYANPVFEKDLFEYQYGTNESIKHIPSNEVEKGNITHFYGILKLTNGYTAFKVMSKQEVDEVRNRSKCSNSPAWTNHYPAMGCKTVLIRVANTMKKATKELRETISLDQEAEFGSLKESDSTEAEFKTKDRMSKMLGNVPTITVTPSEVNEPEQPKEEERCPKCGYAKSVCSCNVTKQPVKEEQIDFTAKPFPGKKKT